MLLCNAGNSLILLCIIIKYLRIFLDTASKHACQGFYDSLRAEVAQHNIKVLVVSPGYVRTNLSINALDSDGSKHGGNKHAACDKSYKVMLYYYYYVCIIRIWLF